MTDQIQLPILVTVSWATKALAIGSMIFGGSLWILSFIQGEPQSGSGFLLFVLLGLFLFILARSSIKIDEESVNVTVPYGRFRICWNEVKVIKTRGPLICLEGDEKRMVLSIAQAGKNTDAMLAFFNIQAEKRGIQVLNEVFFPITHKNTRVGL